LVTAVTLVGISLLPAIFGLAGMVYFFGALALSVTLLQVCIWAASSRTNARAKWLMHATVAYIPVLLALMVFDKTLR
jgi:protoheme IX farnesyltransferase